MTKRLSIRIADKLRNRLAAVSKESGRTLSDVVCEALKQYVAREESEESAYEMAKRLKLIGCVKNTPSDLSTNPAHLENFGKA